MYINFVDFSSAYCGTNQHPTQDQYPTQVKIRHGKIRELTEATPWRDRAKASSTGREPGLLRSESLRMDETAPAASSALKSKESPSLPASGPFVFNSSALEEGGSTLYAGGLQTVIGMTSNGCSAALQEESFVFAVEPERGCELGALGTSAGGGNTCPSIRTWVEEEKEDAPSFETLPLSRAFLLNGVQSFPLHAPRLSGQRLHPSQKLSLGGLGNGRPDGREFHSGRR